MRAKNPMYRHQKAFTLIEIMLVIAIIGALAGIAIPSYQKYLEKTKIAKAVAEISMIATSLKLYYDDNRQFPPSLNTLGMAIPIDPWGHAYQYLPIDIDPAPNRGEMRKDRNLNPLNSDFDLYSNGPDGDTQKQLTAARARDDIVRADNGRFVGVAADH